MCGIIGICCYRVENQQESFWTPDTEYATILAKTVSSGLALELLQIEAKTWGWGEDGHGATVTFFFEKRDQIVCIHMIISFYNLAVNDL